MKFTEFDLDALTTTTQVLLSCPSNKVLLGGGLRLVDRVRDLDIRPTVLGSGPVNDNMWEVLAENLSFRSYHYAVFIFCANRP